MPAIETSLTCEQDGCTKKTDELHFIARVDHKEGTVLMIGMCPHCYERWRWFKAERESNQAAITKAFGDPKTAQKARVKVGSIEVKGQYRGTQFYPYYHLVKKHGLKFSYAAEAVELVEKY